MSAESQPRNVARPQWIPRRVVLALPTAAVLLALAACGTGPPSITPLIVPGSVANPREVNLIAHDYSFAPASLELVPGETILLHVINGGLVLHEAVIGDAAVQDAWEVAQAATVGAPPGPTPIVTVPAEVTGLRVVVASGQRVDVMWTVPADVADPADPAAAASPWVVGCHIPGHWARGMQVPIRWVAGDSASVETSARSDADAPAP